MFKPGIDKELEVIPLHRKRCFLFGRDRCVAKSQPSPTSSSSSSYSSISISGGGSSIMRFAFIIITTLIMRYLRAIADIPTDHPSCSKQHAVLQCSPQPPTPNPQPPTLALKPPFSIKYRPDPNLNPLTQRRVSLSNTWCCAGTGCTSPKRWPMVWLKP